MSELLSFGQLGFRHIVSLGAMDHLLFLLVLACVYRLRDWRSLIWAVSAFTVGHSVTLALAVTGAVTFPTAWIELLIPVTIVATAASNLVSLRAADRSAVPRIALVGVFGLIHGAGFANYLRGLFLDSIALPLLGFNLGIEVGQLIVVAALWSTMAALDRAGTGWALRWSPYQARVGVISGIVAVVSLGWAATRIP